MAIVSTTPQEELEEVKLVVQLKDGEFEYTLEMEGEAVSLEDFFNAVLEANDLIELSGSDLKGRLLSALPIVSLHGNVSDELAATIRDILLDKYRQEMLSILSFLGDVKDAGARIEDTSSKASLYVDI